MAKDGYSIILIALACTAGLFLFYGLVRAPFFLVAAIIAALFTLFSLYFFRDPERTVPQGPGLIVSPADGKVIEIVEEENAFMGGRARRVSIFLNVFNVHVNRIPADGRVTLVKYHKGKFLAAWDDKASLNNEQTHIGIDCGGHKLLVKQIAGLIARRIVCRAREGEDVKRGARFGMIKFGSRTDLFLPLNADVRVKVGDKVQGATSVIAHIPE